MNRTRDLWICITLLVCAALACNMPVPGTTEGPPASKELEPSAPPSTPTFEPTPTLEPAPQPRVVVFDGSNFNLFNLDGTLSEVRPAAGLSTWAHPNQYQIHGDAIYYVDSGGTGLGGSVKRVAPTGVDSLTFTNVPNLAKLTFSVSDEGTMIAWAAAAWGDSQLWMAQLDGSFVQTILQSDPADALEDFYTLEVYRWTSNHHPLFAWQITGIGDLLYFGYSSMYAFQPATSTIVPLYEATVDRNMPCWSAVSADTSKIVGSCQGDSGIAGMREREISTGIETVFPLLPDQQQSGAAAYSPSGSKLAFAFGARSMDTEEISGSIAVRSAPGEDPAVIVSKADGYFQKIDWIDENLLVVQGTEAFDTKTYLLSLDGTLTLLSAGELIGLMWP